jgi:uncharacterized protein with HEPN domain
MRSNRERLQDILDAIAKIQEESAKGRDAFNERRLIRVWMVHHLMIIGEAVRAIDPAFRQQHASIPWRLIAGLRNILVHDYFRINHEIVWQTIENDISFFKAQRQALLANIGPQDS